MNQRDKFKCAEKCLYEYKRNIVALKILYGDLEYEKASVDVHGQSYRDVFGFSSNVSNPVEARLQKIETIEGRIKLLKRYTEPITLMIETLNSDGLENSNNKILYEILRLKYFGRNTAIAIMEELHISTTTFTRKRRELVNMTIEFLCIF